MENCIWKGVEAFDKSMWCFRATCKKTDIDVYSGDSNDKALKNDNPHCPYCGRKMNIIRFS